MNTIATSTGGSLNSTEALSRSKAISLELKRVARRARVPRPVHSGGGGFRARKTDRLYRAIFIGTFVALFLLPVISSAIYFGLIAADQYISETRFAVRSGDETGMESLASLASVLNVGQANDGQILAEYVKSRSVIEELQKTIDLRQMFAPGTIDIVAEAAPDGTIEDFVKYWRRQVTLSVDRQSGLITLLVRTFKPEDSLMLSREILQVSEKMVNRLTRRNEENTLQEASTELEFAKNRLEKAVGDMRDARIKAGVLDVTLAATSFSDLLADLHTELASTETQISALRENNVSSAPQLVSLSARAKALRDQITIYERRIAGQPIAGDSQENLAQLASALSDKEVELSIAQNEYKIAVAGFESARLKMERQRSYVMVYVQPALPEKSLYPKRWLMWIATSVVGLLVWAIVAGLTILVRDNMAT